MTIRATSGTVALIATATVCAVLLVDVVVRASIAGLFVYGPWLFLVVWGVYVFAFASKLRADADGVLVQNYLRRTWIPWGRVQDIMVRWQIEIVLDDKTRVAGSGGPAVGALARNRGGGRAEKDADALRELWRAVPAAPDGDDVPNTRKSWDVSSLVVLGALVLWAAISLSITGGRL